jgi:hypothetical protein
MAHHSALAVSLLSLLRLLLLLLLRLRLRLWLRLLKVPVQRWMLKQL